MGFTDSLPLSLSSSPSYHKGPWSRTSPRAVCLFRVEVKVQMIFDFGLMMQCALLSIDTPGSNYRIQNTDGLRPVSLISRGITCFTFTTATTQPSHPERDQWKKSMAATVSGTMWISWVSFGNAETHRCMQTARSGNRYVQIPTIVIPSYAINTLISRGRELNRCPTFPRCFSTESYRRTHVRSSLASD